MTSTVESANGEDAHHLACRWTVGRAGTDGGRSGRSFERCLDYRCDDHGVLELREGACWWDWDVQEFDGSRLRLAADNDLT